MALLVTVPAAWGLIPLFSSSPQSFLFSPTLPPIPVQCNCLFLPLFNRARLVLCLHQSFPNHCVHASLEFFNKGAPSYLLPLAILLNSCTNSSIVLPLCSNFLNSATFTTSLSSPPNSLFTPTKNSPADLYSTSSVSKSSSIFSFYTSADPFYTYERIH